MTVLLLGIRGQCCESLPEKDARGEKVYTRTAHLESFHDHDENSEPHGDRSMCRGFKTVLERPLRVLYIFASCVHFPPTHALVILDFPSQFL